MSRRDDARTVYSSEHGRLCPHCGASSRRCQCRKQSRPEAKVSQPADGIVRVGRTRRGKRGKTVTEVKGLTLSDAEIRALASDLKKSCGTGGAVKSGIIEIQGDQTEALVTELEKRNFRVKRSGG